LPILRMPADTSLGDTLGNLGAQLTQAFNPLNQIRAQDMLAQVQQRQWEIQQQQRIDAANQNAATVYRNANPYGEDPASLEVSANAIASGHGDLNKSIDGVKAIGGWRANQTAGDLYAAAHANDLPPDQLASDVAQIRSGTKTASELASQRANAVLDTTKAVNTVGAVNKATTPFSREAAAIGQPETANKLDTQNTLLTAPVISGSLEDPNVQAQIDQRRTQQAIAGVTPPAGQPVSSGLAAPTAVADITQKNIVAQSAPGSPANVVRAVPAVDPLTGQPVTVAPGATPPPGVFSQPAQGPNTAATAATASAETGAKNVAKARNEDVQADIDTGKTSQNMLRNLATLRQYSYLLPNDSVIDQATATAMNAAFGDLGVTLTAGQSATNAFKAIASQMIADSRKDMGIQRLAGPEIQALATMLPNPKWDPQALGAVLDSFEGKARRGADVGALARKTLGRSSDAGVSQQDHSKYADARDAILGASMPDPSKPPSQTPQTPPVQAPPTLPALKFDPKSNGWLHLQPDGSYR
jgi:hypothetical protein